MNHMKIKKRADVAAKNGRPIIPEPNESKIRALGQRFFITLDRGASIGDTVEGGNVAKAHTHRRIRYKEKTPTSTATGIVQTPAIYGGKRIG